MPKAATRSALVETATKWSATAAVSPRAATSQSRALWALVMVSWVVKVLEATTNRVVAGSRWRMVSARWVPSTLETKWTRSSGD